MFKFIKMVLFWLIVSFAYFWAVVVGNSGNIFDGFVIALLAVILHVNYERILGLTPR